jgi:hypothetical protein
MKKRFLISAFTIFLMQNSFGQTKKIEDNLINIKLITYKVQIADTGQLEGSDVTEHLLFNESESKYFGISNYLDFCTSLKSALKDSSSLIFAQPWEYNLLSRTKLAQMQTVFDTVMLEDPNTGEIVERVSHYNLNFTKPRFIKFYESWSINRKTMEIKKEVIAYEPNFSVEVNGEARIRSYFIIFNNSKNYDLFRKLQTNKGQLYQD